MCATALRILKVSTPDDNGAPRFESSRNYCDSSGVKAESANTDIVWARGRECTLRAYACDVLIVASVYSSKLLTGARNGELRLWDLHKNGPNKLGMPPRPCPRGHCADLRQKTARGVIFVLSTNWLSRLTSRTTASPALPTVISVLGSVYFMSSSFGGLTCIVRTCGTSTARYSGSPSRPRSAPRCFPRTTRTPYK
jgi:hypothetical protein